MLTPIYASLLALMLIGLSITVIKGRRKYGASLGDAGNIELNRRIRAQANLAEYAPIFIILLGYSEYQGLPHWGINLLGIIFVTGRILHSYSLLKAEQYKNHKLQQNPIWRITGMLCTFSTITALAIINLTQIVLHYPRISYL